MSLDQIPQGTNDLLVSVHHLSREIEQLRSDINLLLEKQVDSASLWLKPQQFAKLAGVTANCLAKWRRQGRFSTSSIKRLNSGSRIDYLFHRKAALKDIHSGLL